MASINVVLRKKKRKDGTYPLAIRIIKDRKTSYVHLSIHLEENDWDAQKQRIKRSFPNSVKANNLLLQKLAEVNETYFEVEAKGERTTSASIKERVKKKNAVNGFFIIAKDYLQDLRDSGKYNRYSAERPRLNRFKEFVKVTDIPFEEITPSLLNRYQAFLRGTRNITERTVVNHLVVIRTIYNLAINSGLAQRDQYPFGRGRIIIKYPETVKVGLTEDEVKTLASLDLDEGSTEHHARNIWMFSFNLAGMRASDVLRLQWKDIHDGRLYYTMGKNDKSGSFKLPERAMQILAFYKTRFTNDFDLIFPDLSTVKNIDDDFDVQRRINQKIKELNNGLSILAEKAGISKKLTMHIARHTFGNLSGDKIPLQMLQKLYRHTSITTTIGYQKNFMFKDTDDALDSVVNF